MKRVIQLRRAGGVYVVLTLLFGAIAVNTSNNLLYLVTALMLAYLLGSGVAGRRNILAASVSLELPEEIYAGIPCPVVIKIKNGSRAPLFLIEASLGERANQRAFFPVVQPGGTVGKTAFVTFIRRGRARVENVELTSLYPFGFFKRYGRTGTLPAVVVFPSALKCDLKDVFVKDASQAAPSAAAPLSDTDVVGVRDYAEGDSMKIVHWKSSARTGRLKSRLYETNAAEAERIVDLDSLVKRGVERGLSMAAFAVCESLKAGLPVGLRSGGRTTEPQSGRKNALALLSRLALYGIGEQR